MSKIDLSNPKVLKNYISCQIKEGNGKLFYREKVLCFEGNDGFVAVAPDEAVEYLAKQEKIKEAEEAAETTKEEVIEEVVEEESEPVEDTDEVAEEPTKEEIAALKADLQKQAEDKGITIDKRWGVEKLESVLADNS